jgi:selenocysteine lyase/cysteine desulfurase
MIMGLSMDSRRNFLQKIGAGAAGLGLTGFGALDVEGHQRIISLRQDRDPMTLARDEEFWYPIQKAYYQSPHFINLEGGYFSPMAVEVMESQFRNIQMINEQPSYYMRKRQFEERLGVKKQLARLAGVSHEEIVITRNTTEALNIVIMGKKWVRGDEVIVSSQDYGSMLEAFAMREKKDGVKRVMIDLPLNPRNDQEVIDAFEAAITENTRAIHVTHMINLTGQILPVKALAEMAHAKGIEVISDSAHAFAQLDFKIPDLDCDFMGTSLHKWLCTPLGAGMLYMKREKIESVWPLFGDVNYPDDDIRKFEHIGTHPVSTNLTIAAAIDFHESIGAAYKEARLRYLQEYWTRQVMDQPNLVVNTPSQSHRACAIANVGVKGMSPTQLADTLYKDHGIFTVAINHPQIKGVRITPHLYTRLDQLDVLIKALKMM